MSAVWKTDKWYVSHYNFLEDARKHIRMPDRVTIHDVTLRDGEQQANIIFRKSDKVEIARLLAEAGVQRIEAGMPSVSQQDYEAIVEICKMGLGSKIFSFGRCMKADVDLALKCGVDGIVMEIPSSDHLIKHGYGWPEEKAINLAVEATQYAGKHGLHVAFFTIDSTRAEFDTCWRIIGTVADEGHMDSLVVVDTFGVCAPHAITYFVNRIKEKVDKPLEIHCHNDFGLGVANALAATQAGVDIIHTTVNGIGERMGNTSLEEFALAIELLYGVRTGINIEKLYKLSRRVEELSRAIVPPNKAVVGENIFTVESGIIAGWWSRLENIGMPLEMLPYAPELVGHNSVKIVLGKKSGLDSIKYKLKKHKIEATEKQVNSLLQKVKTFSLKKKRILTDDEFIDMARKEGLK